MLGTAAMDGHTSATSWHGFIYRSSSISAPNTPLAWQTSGCQGRGPAMHCHCTRLHAPLQCLLQPAAGQKWPSACLQPCQLPLHVCSPAAVMHVQSLAHSDAIPLPRARTAEIWFNRTVLTALCLRLCSCYMCHQVPVTACYQCL